MGLAKDPVASGLACRVIGVVDKPAWVVFEPSVRCFKTAAARLNDKIVYQRHEKGIHDGVDQIQSPLQVMDPGRCGLNNYLRDASVGVLDSEKTSETTYIIEEPVTSCSKRSAFGSKL